MKKILLLCMFVSTFVFAQNNQAKLAYQYYTQGEYSKAIKLYKDIFLYTRDTFSSFITFISVS